MTGLKAHLGALLLAGFFSGASTCHGQSGGEATKDPTTPPAADVTLAGVDTSALTPREKKEWSSYVSELLAPCSDVPVSIAQCVQEKRACARCMPAAKFVLKGVRDGLSREQVEKSFHNRFDADKIKDVSVGDSPSKGPAGAPVTIIEFADFECPFCAMMSPILEQTWQAHQQDVRFVYKFMPLSGHPHGEIASRAGVAAIAQGKFWPMHDKMFANREHLEQSDLDSYAKELGMDVSRFHTDMQSAATNERLATDKKLADALGVQGTPTIYINGRDFDLHQDINEWIALELGRDAPTGKSAPMLAPGASAETAADAGASSAAKPDAGAPHK